MDDKIANVNSLNDALSSVYNVSDDRAGPVPAASAGSCRFGSVDEAGMICFVCSYGADVAPSLSGSSLGAKFWQLRLASVVS